MMIHYSKTLPLPSTNTRWNKIVITPLLNGILHFIKKHFICKSSLSKRTTHITPILKSLHWLPIKERIAFKVLLLVFPFTLWHFTWLYSWHHHQVPTSKKSSVCTFTTIDCPPYTSFLCGHRSFSNAAPELLNNLPFQLRQQQSLSSFKSSLKIHLFCHHFSV